jgi:hypothetical protein
MPFVLAFNNWHKGKSLNSLAKSDYPHPIVNEYGGYGEQ